jgi:hypothetical protein
MLACGGVSILVGCQLLVAMGNKLLGITLQPGHTPYPHKPSHHPKTQLQQALDRWSSEGWHRIRDAPHLEDAHPIQSCGAGVITSLQTAMKLLRLEGPQLNWADVGY